MNSIHTQLVHYLFLNKGDWHASGQLQRMVWRNRGKTATPRSVVRRLEEAQEMSEIAVTYKNGSAQYRWIPHEWRDRYIPINKRTNPNTMWRDHEKAEHRIFPAQTMVREFDVYQTG